MGFANKREVEEFFRECPEFEAMLIHSGIILVKYWFSVSDDEQDRRFQDRLRDPLKRWKISDIDLEGRSRWVEYSRAKDDMFRHTDTAESPWWVIESDDKRRTRLNCISHLLSLIPYKDVVPPAVTLKRRTKPDKGYVRSEYNAQRFVPNRY